MTQNIDNSSARRYKHDELSNIVRSLKQDKRKVEAFDKHGAQGYAEVGETYSVTQNWNVFWSFFKLELMPNDDVYHYGGKEITVLKVDGDLVRVSFTNKMLNDGWLPAQVLRNKFGEALIPAECKSDFDEMAQQKIKLKNQSLRNNNDDLQIDLINQKELNTKLMAEIRTAKDRVALLEKCYENGVKTNKNLETKCSNVHERNVELETKNKQLLDKIDMFRKTTVKREIESLPEIIENCTINSLTNATITIQKQIQIKEDEERQKQKRLKNQIETQKDQHLCRICMVQPRNHMFRPCFHLCACESCARRIAGHDGSCPICRGNIESVLPVYNV